MTRFTTRQLPVQLDVYAPDGSEIRLLSQLGGGSMVHCTLPPGGVSKAVRHQTVEELWYFLSGEGEVWRKQDDYDNVVQVHAGTSLTIPVGVHFQFRNTGDDLLCFVLVTMPPWPGESEAVPVNDYWTVPDVT